MTLNLALVEGVFRSVDAGKSWIPLSDGNLTDRKIRAITAVENTLFAGTDNGLYRFNIDTWERLAIRPAEMSENKLAIHALAVDEHRLYVAAGDELTNQNQIGMQLKSSMTGNARWSLYRSTDRGDSRKKMGSKLEKVESSIEEENGKHIAVITVKEHSASRSSGSFTAYPMIRFNRVSGWKLGTTVKMDLARARFLNGMPTSNIFGYAGYGFGDKIIDYEIGVKLNGIYKLLSCEVKTELEKVYLNYPDTQMFVIRPVGFDLDPEKVPETITTFQELLLFFDKHDLYGKRYSFETFEITEPQYIIFPNHLNGLINTINRKW